MSLYWALLIPVATAAVLFVIFKHKTAWWEYLVPTGVSLIVILFFHLGVSISNTSDTEYWSGIVTKAEHYESWDEWIDKTCSSSCCCDEDGFNCITTYYDCSYVRNHPEYWRITDSNGLTRNVSKTTYDKLATKFGNETKVDMKRRYHKNDGDMYVSMWPKTDVTLECMVTSHSYENRTQTNNEEFSFEVIDSADIADYNLRNYPSINGYSQLNLLGSIENKSKYNRQLELLNAKLGKKKQVKVFFIVFNNEAREAGFKQEQLWKGGNKNEFVVCIGLDNTGYVEWCHPFSWEDDETTRVNVQNYVQDIQGPADMGEIINFTYAEVEENFTRKQFEDFSYISVVPTSGQVLWTFIITLLVNLGISIWLIRNEFVSRQTTTNGRN